MRVSVLILILLLSGCDSEKIAQLEKQNRDLQKQLESAKHVSLDTQEKCSDAARRFAQAEYPADKDTILRTVHNHYNQSLGKCLVLIEWHYNEPGSKTGSWYNFIALYDVYQNDQYAEFSQYTLIGSDYKPDPSMYNCEVAGDKCTSMDEFNKKVRPYMSN